MNGFVEGFTEIDLYLLVIMAILVFILSTSIYNTIKIRSLTKKYNRFISSFEGTNIEKSLESYAQRVEEVSSQVFKLENHCNQIDRTLIKCIQKVGMVRYNAFQDVGSDLSFAIALLDSNDDGVVINGIYSRDSSSTYAKPIAKGKSKYTLSVEELQALDMARKSPGKE